MTGVRRNALRLLRPTGFAGFERQLQKTICKAYYVVLRLTWPTMCAPMAAGWVNQMIVSIE